MATKACRTLLHAPPVATHARPVITPRSLMSPLGAHAASAALAMIVPHASMPSPIFAFMVPPAAVSAVACARHCRAANEESPDVLGRRTEEIQGPKTARREP